MSRVVPGFKNVTNNQNPSWFKPEEILHAGQVELAGQNDLNQHLSSMKENLNTEILQYSCNCGKIYSAGDPELKNQLNLAKKANSEVQYTCPSCHQSLQTYKSVIIGNIGRGAGRYADNYVVEKDLLDKEASGTFNTFIDNHIVYKALNALRAYATKNGMPLAEVRYLNSEHGKIAGQSFPVLNDINCELSWIYGSIRKMNDSALTKKGHVTATVSIDQDGKFIFPRVIKLASGKEYPFEKSTFEMLQKNVEFDRIETPIATDIHGAITQPTYRRPDVSRWRAASLTKESKFTKGEELEQLAGQSLASPTHNPKDKKNWYVTFEKETVVLHKGDSEAEGYFYPEGPYYKDGTKRRPSDDCYALPNEGTPQGISFDDDWYWDNSDDRPGFIFYPENQVIQFYDIDELLYQLYLDDAKPVKTSSQLNKNAWAVDRSVNVVKLRTNGQGGCEELDERTYPDEDSIPWKELRADIGGGKYRKEHGKIASVFYHYDGGDDADGETWEIRGTLPSDASVKQSRFSQLKKKLNKSAYSIEVLRQNLIQILKKASTLSIEDASFSASDVESFIPLYSENPDSKIAFILNQPMLQVVSGVNSGEYDKDLEKFASAFLLVPSYANTAIPQPPNLGQTSQPYQTNQQVMDPANNKTYNVQQDTPGQGITVIDPQTNIQSIIPENQRSNVRPVINTDPNKPTPMASLHTIIRNKRYSWQMSEFNVEDIKFSQLPKGEGIVLLGAGGNLDEWIQGVTNILNEEDIAKGSPEQLWDGFYKLTTSGGRMDLVLPFKEGADINVGKLAMWRLGFGDCSWISDYKSNYKDQHTASQKAFSFTVQSIANEVIKDHLRDRTNDDRRSIDKNYHTLNSDIDELLDAPTEPEDEQKEINDHERLIRDSVDSIVDDEDLIGKLIQSSHLKKQTNLQVRNMSRNWREIRESLKERIAKKTESITDITKESRETRAARELGFNPTLPDPDKKGHDKKTNIPVGEKGDFEVGMTEFPKDQKRNDNVGYPGSSEGKGYGITMKEMDENQVRDREHFQNEEKLPAFRMRRDEIKNYNDDVHGGEKNYGIDPDVDAAIKDEIGMKKSNLETTAALNKGDEAFHSHYSELKNAFQLRFKHPDDQDVAEAVEKLIKQCAVEAGMPKEEAEHLPWGENEMYGGGEPGVGSARQALSELRSELHEIAEDYDTGKNSSLKTVVGDIKESPVQYKELKTAPKLEGFKEPAVIEEAAGKVKEAITKFRNTEKEISEVKLKLEEAIKPLNDTLKKVREPFDITVNEKESLRKSYLDMIYEQLTKTEDQVVAYEDSIVATFSRVKTTAPSISLIQVMKKADEIMSDVSSKIQELKSILENESGVNQTLERHVYNYPLSKSHEKKTLKSYLKNEMVKEADADNLNALVGWLRGFEVIDHLLTVAIEELLIV